ncbi:MAM domain-containing glycosylphosphatidylinositol anchor protein 1 [Liparis tanakae]|uniref:MAM domain-containing glycosylphosphatidylinositol anchor protein 1 n=1 Tax=Liparis tanakae TaxID=230148 RepID=A0A4Z2E6B4_9TELE|nr:MAM domain-containing glycosylphosphatidylinositol anchor protein 1 [Liparis tanakae]
MSSNASHKERSLLLLSKGDSGIKDEDLDVPVLTVHQTISDVRGSYYQEKTVFLRCTVNSNPPARFIWKRGSMLIEQSKDNGVDIYEPLYTQVHANAGFVLFTSSRPLGAQFILSKSLSSFYASLFHDFLTLRVYTHCV